MKKKVGKYYDIMTVEGSNEATIFLYGYIGEEWSWDGTEYKQTGITDTDFLQELGELAKKYTRLNLRINSFGGEIYHGLAIVTAIQRCPVEVHTYIDGIAASMAGVIWMAAKNRHMAKNSMLMIHAGSNICWGNAKDMRECADILDQFTKTLCTAMATSTGQEYDDIWNKYFADYADHWLTHDEVDAQGWITDKEEYDAATDAEPEALARMTYRDLVAHFKEKESPKGQSIMQQLKSVFTEIRAVLIPPAPMPDIQSQTNIQDMKLEDFKASLADGSLTLADVKAHLDSIHPAPAAAADPGEGDDDDEDAVVAALRQELSALRAEFKAFTAAPAAGKAAPGMPDGDAPTNDGRVTIQQRYDQRNKEMAAAADQGEAAKFEMQ